MKKNIALCLTALLGLTACGSMAQYSSSQKYQDGIYYKPAQTDITVAQATKEDVDELVQETRNSEIFLRGGQNDTLIIPENKAATIRFNKADNTTSVTIFDADELLRGDSWAYT